MPSYTAISNTQVAVNAPLTQQLMQAIRDNPEATADAEDNAPRYSHKAIGNVQAGEKPIIYWARNTGLDGSTYSATYHSKVWCVAKCGTYRFKLLTRGQDQQTNVETRLYKIDAGTTTTTLILNSGNATSAPAFNQADILLKTGDRFYVSNVNVDGTGTGRKLSRLIVSVLQPLTNMCEVFEIGLQGSVSANNNYDSRFAVMGNGGDGTSPPFFMPLDSYIGHSLDDQQFKTLDLTSTER